MERNAYRENLEMILEASGGKRLLTVSDAARVLGRDRRVVVRLFPFQEGWISAATLARELAGGE